MCRGTDPPLTFEGTIPLGFRWAERFATGPVVFQILRGGIGVTDKEDSVSDLLCHHTYFVLLVVTREISEEKLVGKKDKDDAETIEKECRVVVTHRPYPDFHLSGGVPRPLGTKLF